MENIQNLNNNELFEDFSSNIGFDDRESFEFSITRQAKIGEGKFEYTLIDVTREDGVRTQYGIKNQIIYKYRVINEEGREVLILDKNNISQSSESKFRRNIKSYCDALGTTHINLKDLINIKGTLEIKHNSDEQGNVYENVIAIYPRNEFEQKVGIQGIDATPCEEIDA